MNFEWDEEKERKNIIKHGIDFETASRVFKDFYRIEKFDERHSAGEDRYITIGEIDGKAVIVIVMVVYTDRANAVRIISARKATRFEKEEYYDNKKNY